MEMIKRGYGLPPLSSEKNKYKEDKESKIINANDARKLALESKEDINEKRFSDIINKVESAAKMGKTQIVCNFISHLNQEKLIDLGYEVEIYTSYFAGDIYTISW